MRFGWRFTGKKPSAGSKQSQWMPYLTYTVMYNEKKAEAATMRNLQDMKKAVDTLSPAERDELREYLEQQTLKHEIEILLAKEPPETLQAGTLDMARLREATEGMWHGLDEAAIHAIVTAMIEKDIKPETSND